MGAPPGFVQLCRLAPPLKRLKAEVFTSRLAADGNLEKFNRVMVDETVAVDTAFLLTTATSQEGRAHAARRAASASESISIKRNFGSCLAGDYPSLSLSLLLFAVSRSHVVLSTLAT